jgi:general secretion pathway protein G
MARNTRTGSGRPRSGDVEAGFTLIELMVVAAILIALAGVGLVNYRNSKTRASEAVLATDLFNMRDAIDQYYAEKGQYPGALEELVSGGFLRKIPDDPFTMSASTWRTIPSEPDPNNPSAPPGIYNVLSGSDGTALDGTKYAEWR